MADHIIHSEHSVIGAVILVYSEGFMHLGMADHHYCTNKLDQQCRQSLLLT